METVHSQSNIDYVDHKMLMQDAREALKGYYGTAIGVSLVYFFIMIVAGIIPGGSLLIGGPMALGLALFYMNLVRENGPDMNNLFEGFQHFGSSLGLYILQMILFFIGFILFIIPGVILAIGLSQSFFILADNPEMSPIDVMRESWELMKGNKADFFVLCLRFLPWIILSILTLGIGFIFLAPYMYATFANYYDNIRGDFKLADNADNFEYH